LPDLTASVFRVQTLAWVTRSGAIWFRFLFEVPGLNSRLVLQELQIGGAARQIRFIDKRESI
jgi:hypothetical protein